MPKLDKGLPDYLNYDLSIDFAFFLYTIKSKNNKEA